MGDFLDKDPLKDKGDSSSDTPFRTAPYNLADQVPTVANPKPRLISSGSIIDPRLSLKFQLFINTRVTNVDLPKVSSFHSNLSHSDLDYLESCPYQNDWMAQCGIPSSALSYFISKDKLDALLTAGAIRVHDVIYYPSPSGTEKSARLTRVHGTVARGNGRGRKLPHMDIYR